MRALKVGGRADELSVLVVKADVVEIVPAPELAGLGSFETADRLWKQYGDDVSLVCIGPAGELGARASAVLVTTSDHYMRAAARGGLGAVMGSKNLKAIVLDGTGGPGIRSPTRPLSKKPPRRSRPVSARTPRWRRSRPWARRSWSG